MKIIILASILLGVLATVQAQNNVVCYWGTWSHYRTGDGQFRVENINGNDCTHIMYAFFGINAWDASIRIMDSWLDIDLENIKKTVELKNQYPHLKILPSIGGWNEGSGPFSQVAANPDLRARFADNALAFVNQWGFDGFDVDWEYPNQREGSNPADRGNFVLMMQELSARLRPNGKTLSIASGASNQAVDLSYDLPALSNHLDFILVMTYDLWGSWESTTGHNAGLYPRFGGDVLNIDSCIKYYIANGFPANKLILGIPTYGRTFTHQGNTGVGAPASGPGSAGPHSQTAGWLNNNELCLRIRDGYTTAWDDAAHVPYAFNGNEWITYDDERSVREKAAYARNNGLGGTMVWALEADDFRGLCGVPNPLVKAARP